VSLKDDIFANIACLELKRKSTCSLLEEMRLKNIIKHDKGFYLLKNRIEWKKQQKATLSKN
jgi:hypothetical protein